jgi:hypothetical protein
MHSREPAANAIAVVSARSLHHRAPSGRSHADLALRQSMPSNSTLNGREDDALGSGFDRGSIPTRSCEAETQKRAPITGFGKNFTLLGAA